MERASKAREGWAGDARLSFVVCQAVCFSFFCCIFLSSFKFIFCTCLLSLFFVFCVSLCSGLGSLRISFPTVFISLSETHSLFIVVLCVTLCFALTMTSLEAEEDMLQSCKSKSNTGDEGKGVRERVLHGFSWEPLWLVCGQLTHGSQTFWVLCFLLSVFDFYHRGFIRLC